VCRSLGGGGPIDVTTGCDDVKDRLEGVCRWPCVRSARERCPKGSVARPNLSPSPAGSTSRCPGAGRGRTGPRRPLPSATTVPRLRVASIITVAIARSVPSVIVRRSAAAATSQGSGTTSRPGPICDVGITRGGHLCGRVRPERSTENHQDVTATSPDRPARALSTNLGHLDASAMAGVAMNPAYERSLNWDATGSRKRNT
jgi:hypothetical protein